MKKRIERRTFLKSAAVAAVGPWIVPSSVFGANERINVACIGVGNQGTLILGKFIQKPEVQIVAVCDTNRASHGYKDEDQYLGRDVACDDINRYYAEKRGTGTYKDCTKHIDFQEVLAREDVDAVTIVVPDQWHAVMTVRAAEAGKDIYCEKPLSLTIGQGKKMVEAVRKHKRVLQTGSHERSNPQARHICELVRNGRIGEVKRVITNVGYNNKTGPGPGWQPMPVPEGFDYARWLGPAPDVPYHQDRCLYRFRFNYDYSGGQVTNYGAHSNDLAQWGLGMDDSGPVEIEYIDAKWLPEGSLFNTALETQFRARYANGVELLCKTDNPSVMVRFEGTEGMVEWGYSKVYGSEPKSLIHSKIGDNEIRLYHSDDHVQNFLDCIRTRQDPAASVDIGHRSATLCHLGNAAIRLGRTVKWDPAQEQFIGDDEANAMMDVPMRDPWTL
jgi:predicted dehydrogenase